MEHPKGKLIAVGGAEDKGTDLERGQISRNNLNFFELGILRRIVEEAISYLEAGEAPGASRRHHPPRDDAPRSARPTPLPRWAVVGGAIAYGAAPYYYGTAPYYDPGYAAPAYSEPAPSYWYYCPSAGGYYPDVPSCPEQWVPVTPQG